MKIEIYSKYNCPYCIKAKQAFEQKGYEYIEYQIGSDASKEDVQSRVDALGYSVNITTVPQIFIDDDYVGGYSELKQKWGL